MWGYTSIDVALLRTNQIDALTMQKRLFVATFTSNVFLIVFMMCLHCAQAYVTKLQDLFQNPCYGWQIKFPEKRRLFRIHARSHFRSF